MTFEIGEEDRQLMILALAILSVRRYGFTGAAKNAALALGDDGSMFDGFRMCNSQEAPKTPRRAKKRSH